MTKQELALQLVRIIEAEIRLEQPQQPVVITTAQAYLGARTLVLPLTDPVSQTVADRVRELAQNIRYTAGEFEI